ncbi:hypothetical protein J6590_090314 [Homalodisca vitripennis]|nr:hypothetical protein J6590_090314 [Homalodisca vitripennis]
MRTRTAKVYLYFNDIGSDDSHYSQHLTMRGKRLLAELVVAGVRKASLVTGDRTPSRPPPSPPTSSSPPPPSPPIPPPPPPSLLLPSSATQVESPLLLMSLGRCLTTATRRQ